MLISQKHVFLKCKAFRACAICVNILRHKRILYGTAHLYTYTVMKKYNTLKVKIVKKCNGPYKLYGQACAKFPIRYNAFRRVPLKLYQLRYAFKFDQY